MALEVVVMLIQDKPMRRLTFVAPVEEVEGERLRWLVAQAVKRGMEAMHLHLVQRMKFEATEIPWESPDPTTRVVRQDVPTPPTSPPHGPTDGPSSGTAPQGK